MTKEDYLIILDLINKYGKESREIKKIKEKATILVERFNLDENYQKSMQELRERFQRIENPETTQENE